MRKVATTIFVLVLSGLGTLTATAGPKPEARQGSRVRSRWRQVFPGPRGLLERRLAGFLDGHQRQGQEDLRVDRKLLFVRIAVCARRLPTDDLHRHERIRQTALQVRLRAPRIPRRSTLPGV